MPENTPNQPHQSRRDFLKLAGAGAASLFLTDCARKLALSETKTGCIEYRGTGVGLIPLDPIKDQHYMTDLLWAPPTTIDPSISGRNWFAGYRTEYTQVKIGDFAYYYPEKVEDMRIVQEKHELYEAYKEGEDYILKTERYPNLRLGSANVYQNRWDDQRILNEIEIKNSDGKPVGLDVGYHYLYTALEILQNNGFKNLKFVALTRWYTQDVMPYIEFEGLWRSQPDKNPHFNAEMGLFYLTGVEQNGETKYFYSLAADVRPDCQYDNIKKYGNLVQPIPEYESILPK